MNEQKLANAIGFLSLEIVTTFAVELNIPVACGNEFRSQLRQSLGDYIENNRYLKDYQISDYRIIELITKDYGIEFWRTLRTWMEFVFLDGGSDRHSERVWTLILSRGCPGLRESGHLGTVSQCLCEVQSSIAIIRSETTARFSEIRKQSVHEWDAKMMPLIYADIDNLFDKILLIHTYNQLIREWDLRVNESLEQLLSIHQWGKQVAKELGIREVEVTFPGAWRYL